MPTFPAHHVWMRLEHIREILLSISTIDELQRSFLDFADKFTDSIIPFIFIVLLRPLSMNIRGELPSKLKKILLPRTYQFANGVIIETKQRNRDVFLSMNPAVLVIDVQFGDLFEFRPTLYRTAQILRHFNLGIMDTKLDSVAHRCICDLVKPDDARLFVFDDFVGLDWTSLGIPESLARASETTASSFKRTR